MFDRLQDMVDNGELFIIPERQSRAEIEYLDYMKEKGLDPETGRSLVHKTILFNRTKKVRKAA